MNCHESQQLLETREQLSLPVECEAHARGCPACLKKLELHRRMIDGLLVVRAACRPPDLAGAIVAKIQSRVSAPEPLVEKLRRWWQFVSPTTPLKASVFYGMAGVLILALCWAVLYRASTLVPLKKDEPMAVWRVSFLSGSVPKSLETFLHAGSGAIPTGTTIETGPAGIAQVTLPGRCELDAVGARLEVLEDGIRLLSGKANIQVQPEAGGRKPFKARTPFALVTVIGTHYSLELTKTSLTTTVQAGRVRVETPGGLVKELGAGEKVIAGPAGWITAPSLPFPQPSLSSATNTVQPGTDRPTVPED